MSNSAESFYSTPQTTPEASVIYALRTRSRVITRIGIIFLLWQQPCSCIWWACPSPNREHSNSALAWPSAQRPRGSQQTQDVSFIFIPWLCSCGMEGRSQSGSVSKLVPALGNIFGRALNRHLHNYSAGRMVMQIWAEKYRRLYSASVPRQRSGCVYAVTMRAQRSGVLLACAQLVWKVAVIRSDSQASDTVKARLAVHQFKATAASVAMGAGQPVTQLSGTHGGRGGGMTGRHW